MKSTLIATALVCAAASAASAAATTASDKRSLVDPYAYERPYAHPAPIGPYAGTLVTIKFDVANFDDPLTIDNPMLPMIPGRRVVFEEIEGSWCYVENVTTTDRYKTFMQGAYAGVRGRVVRDRRWRDEGCDGDRDVLLVDSFDWFAQDDYGNVWKLGEYTIDYLYDELGNPTGTSTDRSWEAGVDGAKAGLAMLAGQIVDQYYRTEYAPGVAEGWARVLRLDRRVTIGLGTYEHCAVIKEWDALDPGPVHLKWYCPAVGLVMTEEHGDDMNSTAEAVDLGLD
jgi:hypothetical protein